jgi:phosphatidylglycerol:prolipoprotein diacylglycerol transferase
MYPILIELNAKYLFVAALALALVTFVRNQIQRRRDPKTPSSSTPLMLLVGAWLLLKLRGGSSIPSVAVLSETWKTVPIFSYGVMLGTAMVVGWFLAMRLARADGISSTAAGAVYMWTAVWAIIGARVLYVVTQYREFESPLHIFMLNRGGLVAYGGLIGGFLASWFTCHRRRIHLLRWADVSAPSVVLGTAITRIGCLLFGCDYGRRSDLPWAIRFPKGSPAWSDHIASFKLPSSSDYSFSVHPTQLYETLAGLAVFALLMYLRRVRKFSGVVFVGWVIGYGVLRSIIEIFRGDNDRGEVGMLSTSQFIGITSAMLGLILLVVLVKRYKVNPAGMRLWEQPVAEPAAPDNGPVRPHKRAARR